MTGRETIQHVQQTRCSFLTREQVDIIAADPDTRLQMILIRCGGGRFITPAQDAQHFITIIERDSAAGYTAQMGGDYIRDVSIPAGR